jgi:nicotinate phosphoribosyltransferase
MFHGAEFGYKRANYLALENWVNVYDGDLGIALSDTYTTDVFLQNFSRKHAKLFDGVRHDSGDPFKFVTKVINRYKELGIDPTTKTIIFSNALDFELYREIAEYCGNRIRCAAGIGTNLTNDCGHRPSNIVMKLKKCRMNQRQPWFECIKLSDDEGKHMGPEKEVEICKYECNIR